MCHRSGTIYQPTETRYISVQIFNFPALSAKPADAMHAISCMNYPLLLPSLSLCLRCAIFHGMGVDKQCRDETYIVPALKYNNIAVFTMIRLLTPSLYVLRRPGCRRKNCDDD